MAAAHGTHSIDLFELRYFFDKSATEENNVPVGSTNMSSSTLLLPHAPNLGLDTPFHTPAMQSADYILLNWENDDIFMRGASALERVIHNLHMYESLSDAGKMYKKLKKRSNQRQLMKEFCPCLEPGQADVEARLIEIVQTFQTQGVGPQSWRAKDYSWPNEAHMLLGPTNQIRSGASTPCSRRLQKFGVDPIDVGEYSEDMIVPPLVNSTMWNIWRQQLPMPVASIWNYQLAHYIYCRLNIV